MIGLDRRGESPLRDETSTTEETRKVRLDHDYDARLKIRQKVASKSDRKPLLFSTLSAEHEHTFSTTTFCTDIIKQYLQCHANAVYTYGELNQITFTN